MLDHLLSTILPGDLGSRASLAGCIQETKIEISMS